MNQTPSFQNQSITPTYSQAEALEQISAHSSKLRLGAMTHRRHCGEFCPHLRAPLVDPHLHAQFHSEHQALQELFDQTRHPIYLHQQGCLAREATDYRLARLHFLAEQALLSIHDHGALAANHYELALLASLQKNWPEARSYIELSQSHAQQSGDPLTQQLTKQLKAALPAK